MGRTKEQQREYMREYRRVKRLKDFFGLDGQDVAAVTGGASARIAELEEEVRHLKEELAKRPSSAHGVGHGANADAMIVVADSQYGQRFNTRPFTPVPKKGK